MRIPSAFRAQGIEGERRLQILQMLASMLENPRSEKVTTAFFRKGETKIELLQGQTSDSVITRFIEKKGEGIHHIAFDVADIYAEMKRLEEAGFTLLNPQPKPGADNKLICFLHPKDTSSVLIELCMERPAAG